MPRARVTAGQTGTNSSMTSAAQQGSDASTGGHMTFAANNSGHGGHGGNSGDSFLESSSTSLASGSSSGGAHTSRQRISSPNPDASTWVDLLNKHVESAQSSPAKKMTPQKAKEIADTLSSSGRGKSLVFGDSPQTSPDLGFSPTLALQKTPTESASFASALAGNSTASQLADSSASGRAGNITGYVDNMDMNMDIMKNSMNINMENNMENNMNGYRVSNLSFPSLSMPATPSGYYASPVSSHGQMSGARSHRPAPIDIPSQSLASADYESLTPTPYATNFPMCSGSKNNVPAGPRHKHSYSTGGMEMSTGTTPYGALSAQKESRNQQTTTPQHSCHHQLHPAAPQQPGQPRGQPTWTGNDNSGSNRSCVAEPRNYAQNYTQNPAQNFSQNYNQNLSQNLQNYNQNLSRNLQNYNENLSQNLQNYNQNLSLSQNYNQNLSLSQNYTQNLSQNLAPEFAQPAAFNFYQGIGGAPQGNVAAIYNLRAVKNDMSDSGISTGDSPVDAKTEAQQPNHPSRITTDLIVSPSQAVEVCYSQNPAMYSQQPVDVNRLSGRQYHPGLPSFEDATNPANFPFVEGAKCSGPVNHGVVKLKNIPFASKRSEIIAFLGRNSKILNDSDEPVHIIMERVTSKTMDAYVEFNTLNDAIRAVDKHKATLMRGRLNRLGDRPVEVELSSQTALLKDLFPVAAGVEWNGSQPVVRQPTMWAWENFKGFISEEEMTMLVKHVEVPSRSPFSKECPQRPYECLISTLKKFPWWMTAHITILQRHSMYRTTVELLQLLKYAMRSGRDEATLNRSLLKRVALAGMRCPGFTVTQRDSVFRAAELSVRELPIDVADALLPWPGAAGWCHLYSIVPKRGVSRELIEWYAAVIRKTTMREVACKPMMERIEWERRGSLTDISYWGYLFSEIAYPHGPEFDRLTLAEAAHREFCAMERVLQRALPRQANLGGGLYLPEGHSTMEMMTTN